VAYNVGATAVKVIAAVLTGSVSIFSEAAHSATDIIASLISYLSVRVAEVPPDDEHNYGHGKAENVTAFTESILILLVVAYIAFESVKRLLVPQPLTQLDVGVGVMVLSTVTSGWVAWRVGTVGRETQSPALITNAQHLLIDCVTSAAVVMSLVVTRLTGWPYADSVAGLLFTVWLGFGAVRLARQAIDELIDRRVSDEDIALIDSILRNEPGVLGYHRLRTRHSGRVHYVDVHVVVADAWSVTQAHDLADRLEGLIVEALAPAHVVIHIDPQEAARNLPAFPGA
jgi:cation diffusion facilitator family transporter